MPSPPPERLDRGRVVVALDLEGDSLAVTEIEHARVLAGPWRTLAAGRQPLEQSAECLYPQCSDQSSEKTASSKWFGSRSSSSQIGRSPSVRPSARVAAIRRPASGV